MGGDPRRLVERFPAPEVLLDIAGQIREHPLDAVRQTMRIMFSTLTNGTRLRGPGGEMETVIGLNLDGELDDGGAGPQKGRAGLARRARI